MAFPVPTHLPRKQDVSSQILNKIDLATNKSLDSTLAASWLTELDETIQYTRTQIRERIHANLPEFEKQLASSKSVQTRLKELSTGVDTLETAQASAVSTLIAQLTTHASLAQRSSDADVSSGALMHLRKCRDAFNALRELVDLGKFPQVILASVELETLLEEAPSPISQATVISDIRKQFRALRDRTEEQLSEAYSRSVSVTPKEITIHPSVQIRQAPTILTLSEILTSLSPSSLSSHLTALRRDLTSYHMEHILSQPVSLEISNPPSITTSAAHILRQIPAPPDSGLSGSLDNLRQVLSFLSKHLFPSLPESHRTTFPRSLVKPLTDAILNYFLIPSLPSSFDRLPPFLELLAQAVSFESKDVGGVLLGIESEGAIKNWADGVGGHYERKRRLEILDTARAIIMGVDSRTFVAEEVRAAPVVVVVPEQAQPTVVPVNTVESPTAWGFDDDGGEDSPEQDGWGFDEEEPEPEVVPEKPPTPEIEVTAAPPAEEDAWGWNDDEGEEEEDDPWDDTPLSPPMAPDPIITSPKLAGGLQKFSAKKASRSDSTPSSATSAMFPSSASNSSVLAPSPLSPNSSQLEPEMAHRPPKLVAPAPPPPPETYVVSEKSKEIIRLVESALREGTQFASSNILTASSSSAAPGTLLLQSATSTLDLYRALYPVAFSGPLARLPESAMKFSNDCLYLSSEVGRIVHLGNAIPALVESEASLRVVGDSWFDDSIEKQRQAVDNILTAADGFADTGEQERYDECEEAVGGALRDIRNVAHKWKDVLAKGKYYTAIGLVVDAALSRVLEDVLTLPDIPDAESRKLSELCRIFNALEGLFVEDHDQPSFVVAYVPSWLKFSYLSELLEASMADITYLFEHGTLVDFTADELAGLVRALFADTALRATTINKFMGGYPVSGQ